MNEQIQPRALFIDDLDHLYEVIGQPFIAEYRERPEMTEVTGDEICEELCQVYREAGRLRVIK